MPFESLREFVERLYQLGELKKIHGVDCGTVAMYMPTHFFDPQNNSFHFSTEKPLANTSLPQVSKPSFGPKAPD